MNKLLKSLLLAAFLFLATAAPVHAATKTIKEYAHDTTPDGTDALLMQDSPTLYEYSTLAEIADMFGTNYLQPLDSDLTALAALGTTADRYAYTTGANTWAEGTVTSFGRSLLDDADAATAQATLGLVIGTDIQAYDADTAACAGITTAADVFCYYTGTGTAAAGTVTSFGRSLIDDAAASNARSTLGLVLGTDVEPHHASLTSIAGLTTGADKGIYTTASNVYATYDFTAFARTLLDDADASEVRGTLGLGTLATQSGTFSGTSSGTNTGDQTITLTGDVTGTGTGSFAATIANDAVTNGKAANMANGTIKGRSTAGTGDPEDLTASEVKTILGVTSSDVSDFTEAAQDAVGAMVDSTLAYTDGTPELGVVDNTSTQKIEVVKNSGAVVSTRKQLNFIEGTNVTLTVSDDAGNDQTDITIDASTGGSGISDGDYGDITVSGSGTALTIDNTAVTYAKIQNVSATDKLLGRSTAGAGSIEEIACDSTCRALLDDTSTSAQRTTLGLAIGSDVQAYDADLTTYAGITPSANVQSFLGSADYAAMRTALGLVIGTNVQAYDADLTTYAGITPSANVQTLLSAADYAAVRSALSLVVGTNVQAYDGELAALAGLTSAADKVPYFTGSGTAALADFSAGGRALANITGTSGNIPYFSALNTASGFASTAGGRSLVGITGTSGNIPYFSGTDTASGFASTAGGRALVGVTGAADTLPYYTSSSAATTTALTSTARSLLDDTSITAMKTTLGIRQEYCVAMSDFTTDLTTGNGKAYLYLPAAATVLNVRAFVNTAPTGAAIKVDVKEAGSTLMTTNKITIDASTKTSLSAGTQPGLTDTSIAANAEITFDITQIGSTIAGKGLVACIEVSL